MSLENLPYSWGTEKFRKSVVDKINSELENVTLRAKNPGQSIEKAIYETAKSKRHYLGYAAKTIMTIRNMVYFEDEWLENSVKEILSRPPPRLRRVLRPTELAKYNIEMMKLRTQLQEEETLKVKTLKK